MSLDLINSTRCDRQKRHDTTRCDTLAQQCGMYCMCVCMCAIVVVVPVVVVVLLVTATSALCVSFLIKALKQSRLSHITICSAICSTIYSTRYATIYTTPIYQLLAAPICDTLAHLFAAHSQLSVNIPLMPCQAAISSTLGRITAATSVKHARPADPHDPFETGLLLIPLPRPTPSPHAVFPCSTGQKFRRINKYLERPLFGHFIYCQTILRVEVLWVLPRGRGAERRVAVQAVVLS